MTEARKNFRFLFFSRRPLCNQQNGKKTKKDETINSDQQQNIVKTKGKTKLTSNE